MKRRRLDRDRFEGMAIPKKIRVIDEAARDRARRRERCEYCGTRGPVDGHHWNHTRGAGGDDSDENLISLCRICHTKAHTGEIPKHQLHQVVTRRIAKSSLPLDPTRVSETESPLPE